MKKDTKIVLVIAVLIIIAWLFDFSSWAKANIDLVIAIMVGSVIAGSAFAPYSSLCYI